MIPWVQKAFEACVSIILDAFRCQPKGLFLLPISISLLLLLPVVTLTLAFFATINMVKIEFFLP